MWSMIRSTPRASTFRGLLLLAFIAGLRTINAAAENDPTTAAQQATADRDNVATDERTFELYLTRPEVRHF